MLRISLQPAWRHLCGTATWVAKATTLSRHYSSVGGSVSQADISRLRNIGIIAHIDAGKTTTTERMLYYAGVTQHIGNVDSGDTVMDYLEAERARGITIQAAAVSFDWSAARINLIDTPGHADFNFEVLRSLRVLDGAVTILDGVAGVEALTEKVWQAASALHIPRLVFVNKMDRAGAGFGRTVREVVAKLRTPVALLTLPYFEGESLVGVVDVVHGSLLRYKSDDGKQVEVTSVDNTPQAAEATAARTAIIEQLSTFDDAIVEEFVESGDVSTTVLVRALQRATHESRIVPVLAGASFRNIGIQPLLDAIVQYLPPPSVLDPPTAPVVRMLAFKVRQDAQRGTLVYVRVYNGTLRRNSIIYNTTTKTKERVSRLLRMKADEPIEVDSVGPGDIAVILGTSDVRTGDTLVAHATKPSGVSSLPRSELETSLLPIPVPPPVFVSRISPRGPGDMRQMKAALDILLREDPSLHLAYDEETGQYLLSGLGELHLEISTDRLANDLKARINVGEVMISYKETLAPGVAPEATSTAVDAYGAETTVRVRVSRRPASSTDSTDPNAKRRIVMPLIDDNVVSTRARRHPLISEHSISSEAFIGVMPVLAQGGQLGRFALLGLQFDVDVEIAPEAESAELVARLVREASSECLASLDSMVFELLEPVMAVQVSVPQSQLGTVMTDLSVTRRGSISGIVESADADDTENAEFAELAKSIWTPVDHTMYMSKHGDEQGSVVKLQAKVPLRTLIGYLSSLRSMTQGRGTFEMTFSEFTPVAPQDVAELLEA